MTEPRVQVIHCTSDEGCSVEVFIDGKRVTFDYEDVDPGRGYQWSELGPNDEEWGWKGRVLEARDVPLNPDDEYQQALYETLVSATDSKYIDGKPDDWHEQIEGV